ncbi:MAG: hypothetical protein KF870_10085 [Leadbetterella sp.]|nr:hypothetical protein [Leadbetterella sp.]
MGIYKLLFLGSVSGTQLLVLSIFYVLFIVFCLYLVISHERKWSLVVWGMMVLAFPVAGGLAYLLRWFSLRSRVQ